MDLGDELVRFAPGMYPDGGRLICRSSARERRGYSLRSKAAKWALDRCDESTSPRGERRIKRSSRQFKGVLALNGLPDQATGTLDKGELVGEAAFQQNTDAKVASHIGHCDQSNVLGDA